MKTVVHVNIRLWGDGFNPYHSHATYVDGRYVGGESYCHGSEPVARQCALEALERSGAVPKAERHPSAGAPALWRYMDDLGHALVVDAVWVARKRDLHNGGRHA